MRKLLLASLLFVIALPAGGRAHEFVTATPHVVVVYTASAEWYPGDYEVSIYLHRYPNSRNHWIAGNDAPVYVTPYASIWVFDWKHNRSCSDRVEPTFTQWTVDPTMSSATLDLPQTKCGSVRVTWTATTAGPDHYHWVGAGEGSGWNTASAGGGAGNAVSRPATAVGRVGDLNLGTAEWCPPGECSIGRYDYASADADADRFVLGGLDIYEGITTEFWSRSTAVSVKAAHEIEASGTTQDGFGPYEARYGCVLLKRKKAELENCGPVEITVDPLLRTASVSGTWADIHFSLKFAAQGRVTSEHQEGLDPETPVAVAYGEGGLSQAAGVSGWVWGRGYGTLRPATYDIAILCRGLGVFAWYGNPDAEWW